MGSIELSFQLDESPNRPNGYWYAAAKGRSGAIAWDASGDSAHSALFRLAQKLIQALHDQEEV